MNSFSSYKSPDRIIIIAAGRCILIDQWSISISTNTRLLNYNWEILWTHGDDLFLQRNFFIVQWKEIDRRPSNVRYLFRTRVFDHSTCVNKCSRRHCVRTMKAQLVSHMLSSRKVNNRILSDGKKFIDPFECLETLSSLLLMIYLGDFLACKNLKPTGDDHKIINF